MIFEDHEENGNVVSFAPIVPSWFWTMTMNKITPCLWFDDPQMLQDKDPQKRDRVMRALLKKVKLDIAALQRAYDGNV